MCVSLLVSLALSSLVASLAVLVSWNKESTSGSAQFLGHRLLAWSSKKSRKVRHLHTEDEYIALWIAVLDLWMRSQLRDYGFMLKGKLLSCIRGKTKSQAEHITKDYRESALQHTPMLVIKQMSPETLKELQDESVSE
ncbi:hypothetical protein Tco_0072915 [Tanacetum coccineum]